MNEAIQKESCQVLTGRRMASDGKELRFIEISGGTDPTEDSPVGQCRRCRKIQELVDEQAKDEALWFLAETAPENYLQRALRRLHAVVEGDGPMGAVIDGRSDGNPAED